MKCVSQKIILIFILVLPYACQNRTNEKVSDQQYSTPQDDQQASDEEKTLSLPYIAVVDSLTHKLKMEENPEKSAVTLNKEDLAEALNVKYPDIKLQIGRVYRDTLTVHIPDATALTQDYGTTGALTYLAEATYAFTGLPEIKVVNFDFKEGDHAVPGPYTRKSFENKL